MQKKSYSASVVMTLVVDGVEMSISHLGDNFLIVRDSKVESENCCGELVVSVDGVEKRRKVILNGLNKGAFAQASYTDPSNFFRQAEPEIPPEQVQNF